MTDNNSKPPNDESKSKSKEENVEGTSSKSKKSSKVKKKKKKKKQTAEGSDTTVLSRAGMDASVLSPGGSQNSSLPSYESLAEEKRRARMRTFGQEAGDTEAPAQPRRPPTTNTATRGRNGMAPGAYRARPRADPTPATAPDEGDFSTHSQQQQQTASDVPVITAECVRSNEEVEQEVRQQILEEAQEARVVNMRSSAMDGSRSANSNDDRRDNKPRQRRSWLWIGSLVCLVLLIIGGIIGVAVVLAGDDGGGSDSGEASDDNDDTNGFKFKFGSSFETGFDGFAPPPGDANRSTIVDTWATDGDYSVQLVDAGPREGQLSFAKASIQTEVLDTDSDTQMRLRFDFWSENFIEGEGIFIESSPEGSYERDDALLWTLHAAWLFGTYWNGNDKTQRANELIFDIPQNSLEAGTIVLRIRVSTSEGALLIDQIKLEEK